MSAVLCCRSQSAAPICSQGEGPGTGPESELSLCGLLPGHKLEAWLVASTIPALTFHPALPQIWASVCCVAGNGFYLGTPVGLCITLQGFCLPPSQPPSKCLLTFVTTNNWSCMRNWAGPKQALAEVDMLLSQCVIPLRCVEVSPEELSPKLWRGTGMAATLQVGWWSQIIHSYHGGPAS